jgi:hypothetical protein
LLKICVVGSWIVEELNSAGMPELSEKLWKWWGSETIDALVGVLTVVHTKVTNFSEW